MKISKNFDFPEEKTYTEHDETNLFNDEKMEIEDKNKKANCLDEALEFKEVDISISKQKAKKNLTDLVNDITDEKPLDDNVQGIFCR